MPKISRGFIYGILLLSLISTLAFILHFYVLSSLSPLIIGILLGACVSPLYGSLVQYFNIHEGVTFCAKRLLRLGIILYGFFVTLHDVIGLGFYGFLLAVSVVCVVFIAAIFIGKILKLDREIAMLVGIGSAVCGAAAILALESTLKTNPSKSSIALSFIVIFGLLGMILAPIVYYSGILPLNDYQWGVYIGASLHEVANVVGASAINPESQNIAVIVKMTRVILLVPMLLIISYIIAKQDSHNIQKSSKVHIPYFALLFLAVIILHSFVNLPDSIVESAQFLSKLCLVFAMSALGLQIDWKKFISFGPKTFVLAFLLFLILIVGNFVLVSIMI